MRRTFADLLDNMPAKSRENALARTGSMAAELILIELRKACDVSQEDLARALNVDEAKLCEIERREDMLLSTLAAYVQAMGGDLEIVAHFPDRADGKRRTIRLKPFAERATPERVA
jgi:DNA-binding XRE family transcriptional regulator